MKPLSLREQQIVGLVAMGRTNREIATQLHLTQGTIKEYLSRLFHKLSGRNRTALALWAYHLGDSHGN